MATETRLGKYQLIEKLATGGMAEIWLSEQHGPGGFAKSLVIKRILPHLALDERFVEMFLDEAKLAAQLTHPNIVQIFDLGEVAGTYFIAMEYVRGHDLDEIVKQAVATGTTVEPSIAAHIVANACAALDYAHNFSDPTTGRPLRLVHRDVSPQNIIVSDRGVVKLLDFGVAKASSSKHKTQTGAVKGKFCYMSPEQISGKSLDGRSDLFALGIVLYELVTGRRPFGHSSELMALTAILNHPPPMPREFVSDLPAGLEQLILRALEKTPEARFQTAEEFQHALEDYLSKSGTRVRNKDLATYIAALFDEALAETGENPAVTSALAGSEFNADEPTTAMEPAGGTDPQMALQPHEPTISTTPAATAWKHEPDVRPSDLPTVLSPVPEDSQPQILVGPSLSTDPTRTMAPNETVPGIDDIPSQGIGPGLIAVLVLILIGLGAGAFFIYDTITRSDDADASAAADVASDVPEGDPAAAEMGLTGGEDGGEHPDAGSGPDTDSPDTGIAAQEDADAEATGDQDPSVASADVDVEGTENDSGTEDTHPPDGVALTLDTAPPEPDTTGAEAEPDTATEVAMATDTGSTASDAGSDDAAPDTTGIAVADGAVLSSDAAQLDQAPDADTETPDTIAALDTEPDAVATLDAEPDGEAGEDDQTGDVEDATTADVTPDASQEETSGDDPTVALVDGSDEDATLEADTAEEDAAEEDTAEEDAAEEDAAEEDADEDTAEEDTAEEDAAEEDAEAAEDTAQRDRRRRDRTAASSNEPGIINITVRGPGRYELIVDGTVVGRGSNRRQEVSPGRHTVTVRRVGTDETRETEVTVAGGTTERVVFRFED